MAEQKYLVPDGGLGDTLKRFEHWRATRATATAPIPDALWDEAVALSRQLPLSRVSKVLRLSSRDLKRRRDGTARQGRALSRPAPAVFVEAQPLLETPVTVEVDIRRGDGARLHVSAAPASAVPGWIQAFLAG